uniref:Protein N-terminal glutamine amidohydrolase n=1 Tax=Schistocephalus solidus TaxID=70667 RepID=A0A0X3NV35_SCHSO
MEINRDICVYTPQYCEENVYKLLENIEIASESDFYAVFISNPKKQVPLFCQRKGDENEDNLVLWDYHVIAIRWLPTSSLVYDLDTTLDFPTSFKNYWNNAIRPNHCFREPFFRFFRVVARTCFLNNFASDRSHMLLEGDPARWLAPPPPYAPIHGVEVPPEVTHTLPKFMNISAADVGQAQSSSKVSKSELQTSRFGMLFTEDMLLDFFS